MDIGHPRDYITGLRLYLDSLRKKSSSKVATGSHIVGNVLVDESAVIREGCRIGPDVVVGPGCVVESGLRVTLYSNVWGSHLEARLHLQQHIWVALHSWTMGSC
ncbi:hypothetical protein HHK36_017899 [Tetracentron sinense]|uniref:Mannose-1-phosphate guanyltransferase C-terminal domain-containing protein n=1 Tax=Tetracentron sinense TaxID=13715 RepID=A0A834YV18_TETSI|nr:hypothetical protein HHK36_017899 [Tetracentron sinense]